MIGYFVVALFVCAAHAQYVAECPPENIEVASYRQLTRDFPPISIPNSVRMDLDREYADQEIREALEGIDFPEKLHIHPSYIVEPFVERCCNKPNYNCSSLDIELRYVKYEDGICWIVWPGDFFFNYTRCTCCTCVLDDKCPVVGRCIETDYYTVDVVAYCFHLKYVERFQKFAIRLPSACRCTASCPVPQNYFYKKQLIYW